MNDNILFELDDILLKLYTKANDTGMVILN